MAAPAPTVASHQVRNHSGVAPAAEDDVPQKKEIDEENARVDQYFAHDGGDLQSFGELCL
jgi:hypothetical protein